MGLEIAKAREKTTLNGYGNNRYIEFQNRSHAD